MLEKLECGVSLEAGVAGLEGCWEEHTKQRELHVHPYKGGE